MKTSVVLLLLATVAYVVWYAQSVAQLEAGSSPGRVLGVTELTDPGATTTHGSTSWQVAKPDVWFTWPVRNTGRWPVTLSWAPQHRSGSR